MIKKKLLLLTIMLTVTGCSGSLSSSSNILSMSESSKISSNSTEISSISSKEESVPVSSSEIHYEEFMDFPKQTIEVDQKEYLFAYVSSYDDLTFEMLDSEIAEYNVKSKTLIGKKKGNTGLLVRQGDKCQMVEIEVLDKGSLNRAWNFEQIATEKTRKNFIVIGDSVSADETYFNKDKTYAKLVADLVGGQLIKNYAIGGTTGTYMYKGSNIEKEYGDNKTAIDGVRVTKAAFGNGELKDVDYAFIAFGHNDQYFQPPLDAPGTFNVKNYDSAHSFKGSYRYMINLLRLANPKVRIILLNCTYSEYAVRSDAWDYKYTYDDYRKAIREVAEEMDCKLIDPWNYMKKYFDGNTTKAYYHDVVHLSVLGHHKLRDFVMKH